MGCSVIVVTGAHGFLGRHVARLFARQGNTVIGIGHGHWQQDEWKSWGLSGWHQADVSLQTLQRHVENPSTIIHCAGGGSVAFSIADPLADFERTVVSTAHVLEYVRLNAPSCRVVYPSSASVYGSVETVPIREDCPAAPISQYGTHKLMAEEMVSSYSRQFGTPASIVRFFSIYGCGLRKQLLWDASCKIGSGTFSFMGTGEETRDWLHVEDAADLLNMANQHASSDCPTVNGGSGRGLTVREILQHLGRNLVEREVTLEFSGLARLGDPGRFVACIEIAKSWGWCPTRDWMHGVAEYAAWWKKDRA